MCCPRLPLFFFGCLCLVFPVTPYAILGLPFFLFVFDFRWGWSVEGLKALADSAEIREKELISSIQWLLPPPNPPFPFGKARLHHISAHDGLALFPALLPASSSSSSSITTSSFLLALPFALLLCAFGFPILVFHQTINHNPKRTQPSRRAPDQLSFIRSFLSFELLLQHLGRFGNLLRPAFLAAYAAVHVGVRLWRADAEADHVGVLIVGLAFGGGGRVFCGVWGVGLGVDGRCVSPMESMCVEILVVGDL